MLLILFTEKSEFLCL